MANMAIVDIASLSYRELMMLQSYANSGRVDSVAAELYVSRETVKTHLKHARSKLQARNSTHAVAIGIRRGLIT
jgi:two-component system NarL family response regulator